MTAVATGILVWITHRAGQRSDEAIATATDNAEASREATEVIARQAWGARLAFVDEVLVTGTEAERNERILWFVQNLGMAPARLELVRLAIGSYEPSVFPSGAEAYVPGRAELATSWKKEVAVPISQPRVLDVGGLIPEHARTMIYYVDASGCSR